MFKRFTIILITTLALTVNSYSASDGEVFIGANFGTTNRSDGELLIKKNDPSEVKDCFERLNRATFAFNQALDGIIVKPLASAYKTLPSPVRAGISNSLDNLSNLITIPNNLLQGDVVAAFDLILTLLEVLRSILQVP